MTVTLPRSVLPGALQRHFQRSRKVMAALGLELVEMPQTVRFAYWLRRRGGRIWMEDPPASRSIRRFTRVREGGVAPRRSHPGGRLPQGSGDVPDAIRRTGLEEKLEVKELSELVEQPWRRTDSNTEESMKKLKTFWLSSEMHAR